MFLTIRKIVFLKDETADAIWIKLHWYIWEPLWELQITSKQKVFSNGFLFIKHFRFQYSSWRKLFVYALQNGSSTALWNCVIVGTLQFVQRMTPKGSLDKAALDKVYLATTKCVIVNKALKQAAEEQTKVK